MFTLRTNRRRNLNRNRHNLKTKEAKLAADQKLGTEQNIMEMDFQSDSDGSEYEDGVDEVQEQRLEELNDIREVIRIHSTAEGAKISAKTKTDASKALQKAEEAYKMSLPPTAEEKSEACIYLLSLPTAEQVRYEVGCVECDCCKCVLKRQQDFLSQKTGIEEVFDKYNAEHGTKHRCIFLPKFHPELNYIERV